LRVFKLFIHQFFLFSSLYFFFSFSLLFISLPCIPGTFQNEVKKASCKDCDAGQFRPSKNGDGTDTIPTTCTSCFPGTYQQELGQVSCLPCFPGEYFSIFIKNFIKNNDYNTYNKLIRINLLFLFEIFFSSNFLLLLILAV
jgi:hypothetical protein